jgi:hypothetical protein
MLEEFDVASAVTDDQEEVCSLRRERGWIQALLARACLEFVRVI